MTTINRLMQSPEWEHMAIFVLLRRLGRMA